MQTQPQTHRCTLVLAPSVPNVYAVSPASTNGRSPDYDGDFGTRLSSSFSNSSAFTALISFPSCFCPVKV